MRSLKTQPDKPAFPQGEEERACDNDLKETKTPEESQPASSSYQNIAIMLVMSALFFGGLIYGGYFERLGSFMANPAELYFRNAGIILKKIVIKGQVRLQDEKIIAALGIRTGQSLIGFSAIEAQNSLSKLGGVRTARVMRLLPSTLLVEIEERRPFARWLDGKQVKLIDRDGYILDEFMPAARSKLPLVVGAGAGKKAEKLIRLLSVHKALAEHIKLAELRVQTYWVLRTKKGAQIKLPPENLALGLARFVGLPNWDKLIDRDGLVIDLRHAGRAFLNEGGAKSPLLVQGT